MKAPLTNPRPPPNSVNQIVHFQADKLKVFNWLVLNMLDDCVLTQNNMSAVDDQGYYRWRMALNLADRRVLFDRAEDVSIFQLAWAS